MTGRRRNMILKEGQLEGAFPRHQPSNPSTVIQEQQHPGGAVEGVRHCLVISLDSTQLSLHIKPCGCRRTFPQEGIRVPAGRDCQVVPGKHGPLRFRTILECHAHLLGCLTPSWPWKRDATVSEDYALMMMTNAEVASLSEKKRL